MILIYFPKTFNDFGNGFFFKFCTIFDLIIMFCVLNTCLLIFFLCANDITCVRLEFHVFS